MFVGGCYRQDESQRERGRKEENEGQSERASEVAGEVNKESDRVYYGLCCIILVAGHRGKSCVSHAMGAPLPFLPSLSL